MWFEQLFFSMLSAMLSQVGRLTEWQLKVLVMLFQKGQGAPAREPVITSQEQKEMMAYYYRKQEELKVSSGIMAWMPRGHTCWIDTN